MAIRILPEDIASQIAAGEVVERPSSVVKELLENSLDAAASYIQVTIQGAGVSLVEVADNGSGIPLDELPLAVSRHATSKLQKAEDLFHVATLGFRGEALASIASVSRLTLTSRVPESEVGGRIQVDGGRVGRVQRAGAPPGTLVRVQDLFYNVPARLKFLKSETTERRHIDELVTRYALANPHVRIHLTQDGRPVLQTSGNGDRREILAHLFSPDAAREMLEVDLRDDDLRISGFISPTSLTRSNRREITFFVNGRWVQDPGLVASLIQAYHTMIMVGRFPMASLFLDLPPETVDVNVHPAKAEVRFRYRDRVIGGVQRAVRRALLAYSPVPGVQLRSTWPAGSGIQQPSPVRQTGSAGWMDPSWAWQKAQDLPTGAEPLQVELQVGQVPLLRLVGQVGAAYLVAEGPDGIYLIDQHAAHERILFERFMAGRDQAVPSQKLLEPVSVDFPPAQARLLEEQLSIVQRIGFEVEPFGPGTFQVRAVPGLLTGLDPAAALWSLVEDFEEDETPLQAEVEARIIARVCKRAAVKAGQVLSIDEQRSLVRDLEACQAPRTCPHGRPTMIHLSVDMLERQFGRRGV